MAVRARSTHRRRSRKRNHSSRQKGEAARENMAWQIQDAKLLVHERCPKPNRPAEKSTELSMRGFTNHSINSRRSVASRRYGQKEKQHRGAGTASACYRAGDGRGGAEIGFIAVEQIAGQNFRSRRPGSIDKCPGKMCPRNNAAPGVIARLFPFGRSHQIAALNLARAIGSPVAWLWRHGCRKTSRVNSR